MATKSPVKLSDSERKTLEAFHRSWPLNVMPKSLMPYAELMRLHRPAGIMMFYFPCLYGAFLVGALGYAIELNEMIVVNAKLMFLSFLMRSALCTWNDILDADIDRQVARTRIRPLARRAVSTSSALIFTFLQASLILATFVYGLSWECLVCSSPFLGLHILYPLMKRLSNHPQVILGMAYPMGVFIAFPAFNQTLSLKNVSESWMATASVVSAVSLSAAIFLWTVLNDTIYAAQDLEDDKKAGVGSPMVYWGDSARWFLRVLGSLQLLSLMAVSFAIKDTAPAEGTVFTALTCGGTMLSLFSMVEGVDLKNPASCGWWFNKGNVIVGYTIASGLIGEYLYGVFK